MEATIGPGETIEGLYDMMSQIAVAQFARNNPNLANHSIEEPTFVDAIGSKGYLNAVQPIDQRELEKPIGKSMVEQITSCVEKNALSSYRLLVKNNEEWQSAYNLRMQQLELIEIEKTNQ